MADSDLEAQLLRDHDRFVRQLARTLVRDATVADDLAQDAWMAALQHGPLRIANLRAWLRTTLQRMALLRHRGESRRRRREAAVPPPPPSPPASDVNQRIQEQRLLLDAVDRLDEPYRTVVVLRFFEQLPPRAIARRLQIPVETVRTRLQRAMPRLRQLLDDRCGSRSAWLLPLLAWSRPPLVPTLVSFALAMHTKAKLALAAAAVLTCVLSLQWLAAPSPTAPIALASESPRAAAASTAALATPTASHREAATADEAASAPANSGAPTIVVRGLVLTADGAPLASVEVGRRGDRQRARSDGSGRFELAGNGGGGAIVVLDPQWATLLHGEPAGSGERLRVLVVGPAIPVSGRVLDEQGQPVRAARLHFRLPPDFRSALPQTLDLAFSGDEYVGGTSQDDGGFALLGCARVRGSTLAVDCDGYRPWRGALDGATNGLTIVLERPRLDDDVVQGIAVDERDLPVADAAVAAGRTATTTDARGEFRLPRAEIAGRRIVASKRGMMPAVLTLPERPQYLRLVLQSRARSIAGRVVDAAGRPLAGAKVWAADPTFLGAAGGFDSSCEGIAGGGGGLDAYRAENEALARLEPEAASAARGPTALWYFVRSDADGHFVLGGLADRSYRLRAQAPGSLQTVELGPFAAGRTDVVLAMPKDGVFARVTGRVVDDLAQPVANASIDVVVRTLALPIDDRTVTYRTELRAETTTDRDGRFALADIPTHAALVVRGDRIEPGFFGGEDGPPFATAATGAASPARVDLLLRCSARCPVRIELSPTTPADAVAFEDAGGQRIDVLRLEGNNIDAADTATLTEGRSLPLHVSSRAVTAVLLQRGKPIGRVPLQLTPGRETVVRQ